METKAQAPWVSYLVIDELTGEGVLREDAPEEIRRKYEEYLAKKQSSDGKRMPK